MTNTNIPAARNEQQDTPDRNSRWVGRLPEHDHERDIHIQYMDNADVYRIQIREQVVEGFSFEEMKGLDYGSSEYDGTQLEESELVRIVQVENHAESVVWELHFPTGAGQHTPIPLSLTDERNVQCEWGWIVRYCNDIHIQYLDDADAYRIQIGELVVEGFSLDEMNGLDNGRPSGYDGTQLEESERVRIVQVENHAEGVGWELHFPTGAGQRTPVTLRQNYVSVLKFKWMQVLFLNSVREGIALETDDVDWQRDGTNIPAERNEQQDTHDMNSRQTERIAGDNSERDINIQYMDDAYRIQIGERVIEGLSFDEMNGLDGGTSGFDETQLEASERVRVVRAEGVNSEICFPTRVGQDAPIALSLIECLDLSTEWNRFISFGNDINIQYVNDVDGFRIQIGERVVEGFSFEEMHGLYDRFIDHNGVMHYADTQLEVSQRVRIVRVEGDEEVVDFELHFPTGAGQNTPISLRPHDVIHLKQKWRHVLSYISQRNGMNPEPGSSTGRFPDANIDTDDVDWQRDGF